MIQKSSFRDLVSKGHPNKSESWLYDDFLSQMEMNLTRYSNKQYSRSLMIHQQPPAMPGQGGSLWPGPKGAELWRLHAQHLKAGSTLSGRHSPIYLYFCGFVYRTSTFSRHITTNPLPPSHLRILLIGFTFYPIHVFHSNVAGWYPTALWHS